MSKDKTETMSPENFIAWATAEIEIAKGEKGEVGAARLDNVRKQVEVAKAFSFEGNVDGLPVEHVDAPESSTTEVSPDKAQDDDPTSTTATNFDEVTKRLETDLAALKKGAKPEVDKTEVDKTEVDKTDKTDKTEVDKTDKTDDGDATDDDPVTSWPDDLNDLGGDPTWGADGETKTDDKTDAE